MAKTCIPYVEISCLDLFYNNLFRHLRTGIRDPHCAWLKQKNCTSYIRKNLVKPFC